MLKTIMSWFKKKDPVIQNSDRSILEELKELDELNQLLKKVIASIGLQNNGKFLLKDHFISLVEKNNFTCQLTIDENDNILIETIESDSINE